MSTNYYFFTKDKTACEMYALSYELVDVPDFGYEIHIGKRSCGWLPLFQAHKGCRSVERLKEIFDDGRFEIYDEYMKKLDWESLKRELIEWNGGIAGVAPLKPYQQDVNSPYYDAAMPNHTPVSHFEYGSGEYREYYFKDKQGYEFMELDFS